MKKTLVFMVLALSLSIRAQTVHYVATAAHGGSDSNNGTPSSPWLTIAHAASQVTAANDIIHVGTGSFTEAARISLAVGVSLEGEGTGNTKVFSSIGGAYETEALISLSSSSVNTNGNQHISGIAFNGNNLAGYSCIWIKARGNIRIFNCSFADFLQSAVTFSGKANGGDAEPSQWSSNNAFHDNVIDNCSRLNVGDWYSGALQIGAQDQMEIHGNTITQNSRGNSQNGYCIKYWESGYNKGLKIYNNTLIKAPSTTFYNDWNFAIELWNYRGGVEIHDNHIEGSIDIDHVQKGSYAFGLKVYRNYFGYSAIPPSSGLWANLSAGLYIEFACDDIYIYQNQFSNLESMIRFSPRNELVKDVFVYYNVVNGIGNSGDASGTNVFNFAGSGYTIRNLHIENNVFYTDIGNCQYGLIFPNEQFRRVYIQNNIFSGFDVQAIEFDGSSTDSLWIRNNIFFSNGTNTPNVTGSPGHYTCSGNLTANPLFVVPGSDFKLRSNSPAINAGINLGYTFDYRSYPVPHGVMPDIGAFEYTDVLAAPIGTKGISHSTMNGWNLKVVPNRFSGIITVYAESGLKIVVANAQGQTMFCQTATGNVTWINCKGKSGVYMIQIKDRNKQLFSSMSAGS